MEFVKTAEDVVTDEKGELVIEAATDADGRPILNAEDGAPVMRVKPDPDGCEVYTSTELIGNVTPSVFTKALDAFKGRKVEHVSASAGGTVVVRVRRKGSK